MWSGQDCGGGWGSASRDAPLFGTKYVLAFCQVDDELDLMAQRW